MHAAVLSLPHSDKAGPAAATTLRACYSADDSRAASQCCCSWLTTRSALDPVSQITTLFLDILLLLARPLLLNNCAARRRFLNDSY
ncbi:hypothetical protein FBY58_0267 [Zymomonas mobilis]|uniref:Uncharacterized protein n=1 Tax=Zymomonas mobilis TaxID=542 RepID=A0A542VZK3_ZYMMB|nr:hypothetical protein FBY58_0267 [Zymomonas mobilis]